MPNDLRILHDMIARLQENKIRKREVSISTYTIRYDQPQTSFSRAPPPRESLRLFPGQLLCQTLLTRAQGNQLGTLDEKGPSKNVRCEKGITKKSEGADEVMQEGSTGGPLSPTRSAVAPRARSPQATTPNPHAWKISRDDDGDPAALHGAFVAVE